MFSLISIQKCLLFISLLPHAAMRIPVFLLVFYGTAVKSVLSGVHLVWTDAFTPLLSRL